MVTSLGSHGDSQGCKPEMGDPLPFLPSCLTLPAAHTGFVPSVQFSSPKTCQFFLFPITTACLSTDLLPELERYFYIPQSNQAQSCQENTAYCPPCLAALLSGQTNLGSR